MNPEDRARQLAADSRRPVILTGAGFSAESGVPTFRGPGGLWEGFRPEELATPEAFAADPHKVWRWYAWRRERVDAARPHAGHAAVAEWSQRCPELKVVTQNVDGLHQRAGGAAEVLELHGSLVRARCSADGRPVADWRDVEGFPPRCDCGALLRPDVVWFGETLPPGAIETAGRWIAESDLLVVAGTSCVVAPASLLPAVARRAEVPIVEVNPQATPLTPVATAHLTGPVGEILPRLVARTGNPNG
ncbi:MAG: NAD-dependent protein deacylase [Candidatus Eisenbacteria bacterium]|nr:NAD-dependent protein deacylase [Candidatus Eisenbacteria bacterium]